MTFINSTISSLVKDCEVDKTFLGLIHQAAQEIGSLQGRRYLVISGDGKVQLSKNKSEEISNEKLLGFVDQKLKGSTKEVQTVVVEDLRKIDAQMYRTEKAKLSISSDVLRKVIRLLDLKGYGSSRSLIYC